MFIAIVISREKKQLIDLFSDTLIIKPSSGDYTAVVTSGEGLEERYKLERLEVDTGYDTPVRAYQHFEFRQEDILPQTFKDDEEVDNTKMNRDLLALRSRLSYQVAEVISPHDFYMRFATPVNSVGTRRKLLFQLMLNDFPCYHFPEDRILKEALDDVKNWTIGPLITSTRSLTMFENNPAKWYIKGILEDKYTDNQKGVNLIRGTKTDELYLFHESPVNLIENLEQLKIEEIREDIISSMEARLFPRSTPAYFIESRNLIQLPNGQWSYEGDGPQEFLFSERLELTFTLPSLTDLYWFLNWQNNSEKPGLEIYLGSPDIRIVFISDNWDDFLSVLNGSRASGTNPIRVEMTTNVEQDEGIRFFDSTTERYLRLFEVKM